jgi:hypothetical protein
LHLFKIEYAVNYRVDPILLKGCMHPHTHLIRLQLPWVHFLDMKCVYPFYTWF